MNNSNKKQVKQFIVNLDDDPYHRWDHVAAEYKDKVKIVEEKINELLSSSGLLAKGVIGSIQSTLSTLAKLNCVAHSKELKGLSKALDIPLGKLVAMQLIYEASTCCTSVLIPTTTSSITNHDDENNVDQIDSDSDDIGIATPSNSSSPSSTNNNNNGDNNYKLILARTMDWSMDYLKDITVEIDFHYKKESCFKATTWVGYVGVLTGISNHCKTAVSINYRRSEKGSFLNNVKQLIKYKWPVGYLVREALITAHDYQNFVNILELSPIVAPCFMTISTIDRGIVIARETNGVFRKSYVLPNSNNNNNNGVDSNNGDPSPKYITTCSNYFVQTNNEEENDDDNNFLYSNQRRCLAKRELKRLMDEQIRDGGDKKGIESSVIWDMFSKFPINNEDTIYGTIMNPFTYSIETRIPNSINGFN